MKKPTLMQTYKKMISHMKPSEVRTILNRIKRR